MLPMRFLTFLSVPRQLQELSDSVEDIEIPIDQTIQEAIAAAEAKILELQAVVRKGLAKQRYLEYMKMHQNEEEMDEDEKCCVLCKCEFTRVSSSTVILS